MFVAGEFLGNPSWAFYGVHSLAQPLDTSFADRRREAEEWALAAGIPIYVIPVEEAVRQRLDEEERQEMSLRERVNLPRLAGKFETARPGEAEDVGEVG